MPQPTVLEKPKAPPAEAAPVKDRKLLSCLWLPLSLLYAETVAHLLIFGFYIDSGTFFRAAFAIAIGFLLSLAGQLFSIRGQRIFTGVMLFLGGFYFSFHLVYYTSMHAFFSWQMVGLAGDVAEFWRETLMAIVRSTHKILLVFLPLAAYIFVCKRTPRGERAPRRKSALLCGGAGGLFALLTAAVLLIVPTEYDILRYMRNDLSKAYKTYGFVTAAAAELWQTAFGAPEERVAVSDSAPPLEDGVQYNVLDIDFDALMETEDDPNILELHRYFKNRKPTEKNAYTGMFRGKNLIFISAEAFTYKALDPEYTPTLYKMYHEGFRFENFYSSLWGGSTATGEYSNLTGNFYTTADCLEKSASTDQRFALGNLFANGGYKTRAFHNHTHTYYDRNLSHPNFGFESFKAIGNGLALSEEVWPKSDLEMALATYGDYMSGETPFLTYYMTVSGHANFSWKENGMALRHKDDINPTLDCNEFVKAYLATQQELELMVSELVTRLSAAGELEDTVFALCCDHYPYALNDTSLSQLYGLPRKDIRNNFELYRNAFILWSPTMEEPIKVDTPCSSYDMLPTIANLFGLSYDSRLLTGTDILSKEEHIVVINTLSSGGSWNFITEQGTYHSSTGRFVPSQDCTLEGKALREYVKEKKNAVAAMRKFSFAVLDHNYYSYLPQ